MFSLLTKPMKNGQTSENGIGENGTENVANGTTTATADETNENNPASSVPTDNEDKKPALNAAGLAASAASASLLAAMKVILP